jgi:hypothetical protein
MIITSRSRIVSYKNCPRLGYLTYDRAAPPEPCTPGAKGLEPATISLPLANGIAVHEAFEWILKGEDPESVIRKVLATYDAMLTERGVSGEDLVNPEHLLAEQRWLIEGLIRAWCRVRLPALRAEYDFVAIEKELLWDVGSVKDGNGGHQPLIDTVRCDVLARRKADGGLFYIEWKTTTSGGDDWAKQWEHNTQLLANTLAIEEVLHERCEGVLIEGVLKDRRAVDKSRTSQFYGQRIQQSYLCYGYKHDVTGEFRTTYTQAKGWQKVAAFQEPEMTCARWVNEIMGADDVQGLFAPLPPIRPNPEQLRRWRIQTLAEESERQAKLAFVNGPFASNADQQDALDVCFPQNDDHCFRYWGHPCGFEPLCFRAQVAEDPIGSGLYRARVSHHAVPEENS